MKNKIYFLMMMVTVGLLSFSPDASAQANYSIKQMTPEVESALNNRRDRFEALRDLKSKGSIGENNQGYVEALSPDAQDVATAENSDRKVIYQTIAEQNNLRDALQTIEKVFAQVQRDKAQAGDKIQLEDGSWTTK